MTWAPNFQFREPEGLPKIFLRQQPWDWTSGKLANLSGCLHLKAFNLTKKGNKCSVWFDGNIKWLEVFLSTSKVSREWGTYMTRLVKRVKTYIDDRYTFVRHVDSPSMSLRQYASFHASKRSAGHFRVFANSSAFPARAAKCRLSPTNNFKKFPLLYLEMSRRNHFSFCNTSR